MILMLILISIDREVEKIKKDEKEDEIDCINNECAKLSHVNIEYNTSTTLL